MKIAMSSTGRDALDILDLRFGRCNYFLVYDTEKKSFDSVVNNGQTAGGGAGIAAAQQIIDEDVQAVLTGQMGPNAFDLMKASYIKVYQCPEVPGEEAVALFQQGKLAELTEAGSAHQGMGK